jgi:hypothetical protein
VAACRTDFLILLWWKPDANDLTVREVSRAGAAAALVVILPTLLRLRSKKEQRTLSIAGVEVKAEWTSLALAIAALCTIASLVAYAALQQLFTGLH